MAINRSVDRSAVSVAEAHLARVAADAIGEFLVRAPKSQLGALGELAPGAAVTIGWRRGDTLAMSTD